MKIVGGTSGKVCISSSNGSFEEIPIGKPQVVYMDYTAILKIVKQYEDKGYTLVEETSYATTTYSYLMKK